MNNYLAGPKDLAGLNLLPYLANWLQSSSSQKTLLAPEFSTIKILEEMGKDKMQQLVSVGIKSSEPTRQDWKLVSNQQEAFEDQLMSIFDMCRALTQIQNCTVSLTLCSFETTSLYQRFTGLYPLPC